MGQALELKSKMQLRDCDTVIHLPPAGSALSFSRITAILIQRDSIFSIFAKVRKGFFFFLTNNLPSPDYCLLFQIIYLYSVTAGQACNSLTSYYYWLWRKLLIHISMYAQSLIKFIS